MMMNDCCASYYCLISPEGITATHIDQVLKNDKLKIACLSLDIFLTC